MVEEIEEIYSLLVPLMDEHLLIPRSNVMEVSALKELSRYNGSVPWLLGTIDWQGTMVPVASFEGACGKEVPAISSRSRIVLFRCLTDALDSRAFGVISQGFPQLVRVSAEVLELQDSVFPENTPVICQVAMANQTPLIPDIEQFEHLIADAVVLSS